MIISRHSIFPFASGWRHHGLITSNGFRFARADTKEVKPEFGNNCYAAYGIVYSMESVNEIFGITENLPKRLPDDVDMWIIDNSSYSRLIEIRMLIRDTSGSPTYKCESWRV